MPAPHLGFLWRENEEAMFRSFHPLADKTNNVVRRLREAVAFSNVMFSGISVHAKCLERNSFDQLQFSPIDIHKLSRD